MTSARSNGGNGRRPSAPLTPDQISRRDFSIRLSQRATELELTGAEVARRAGINPRVYNYYVNGEREPGVSELRKICAALELTADELLHREIFPARGDRDTHVATARLQDAMWELRADDLELLADVATYVSSRRRNKRQRQKMELSPTLYRLALVHEVLIPSIIRTLKGPIVDTMLTEHDDGHNWLMIGAIIDAEKRGDYVAVMAQLAKDLLGCRDEELLPGQTQRREGQKWAATISVRLGPTMISNREIEAA
jgi:transcriptional regulator with XRE-family HTH domain